MGASARATLGDRPTFPAHDPREQLDHVLVRGDLGPVRAVDAVRLPLSDHLAVTIDLD